MNCYHHRSFILFLFNFYNILVFFSHQEFILEKVLSLSGPLLKDISMLDSVIKSKDVISMAEERCSEADVSLFVLVSTFFGCCHPIRAFDGARKARRSGGSSCAEIIRFSPM